MKSHTYKRTDAEVRAQLIRDNHAYVVQPHENASRDRRPSCMIVLSQASDADTQDHDHEASQPS